MMPDQPHLAPHPDRDEVARERGAADERDRREHAQHAQHRVHQRRMGMRVRQRVDAQRRTPARLQRVAQLLAQARGVARIAARLHPHQQLVRSRGLAEEGGRPAAWRTRRSSRSCVLGATAASCTYPAKGHGSRVSPVGVRTQAPGPASTSGGPTARSTIRRGSAALLRAMAMERAEPCGPRCRARSVRRIGSHVPSRAAMRVKATRRASDRGDVFVRARRRRHRSRIDLLEPDRDVGRLRGAR